MNKNNYLFRELFSLNNYSKRCDERKMEFKNCSLKKKKDFLAHYNQFGGSRMNRQLPVNVFRRGLVMHYTINFIQQKIFYDLNQENVVDDF